MILLTKNLEEKKKNIHRKVREAQQDTFQERNVREMTAECEAGVCVKAVDSNTGIVWVILQTCSTCVT